MKEIVYGMPDFENFDFEKYEVGGCTVMEGQPTHWCTDCESGFSISRKKRNKNYSV